MAIEPRLVILTRDGLECILGILADNPPPEFMLGDGSTWRKRDVRRTYTLYEEIVEVESDIPDVTEGLS